VLSDASGLYKTLIHDFAMIPDFNDSSGYDNYTIINVSPSVVPNPYVPAFRIFVYNITRADDEVGARMKKKKGGKRKHGHGHGGKGKGKECEKPPYRDTWGCQLKEPWHSDENSPSRKNGLWTPLGYAQVRSHVI
jgi:endopolyphosphatase